jgi:hypothetical protein
MHHRTNVSKARSPGQKYGREVVEVPEEGKNNRAVAGNQPHLPGPVSGVNRISVIGHYI